MKIIRLLSRIVTGLVFIFSGFVKAIDPSGSAYKFSDYFLAFHLNFLKFLALPLAVLLCSLEFITGISLVSGFRQKTGILSALIMIAFFTPLTLVLALANPISDCGCFGDAIHLTNWQTFGKNIFILALIILLLSKRDRVKSIFKPLTEWLVLLVITILFAGFSYYNLVYLPVIDFLPYKTGTNIPKKMKRPEGAAADQYATTFIYEKAGSRKEFTINNYPFNDSTWKFIEQKSVLVKKGFTPAIHDFSIVNMQNEDITDKVLNNPGFTLLMISRKLADANARKLDEGLKMKTLCDSTGIDFYILTASGHDEVNKFSKGEKFCNTDETTLKTIIRSNPGYVLLKKGTIKGKWSWAKLHELRILLLNEKEMR